MIPLVMCVEGLRLSLPLTTSRRRDGRDDDEAARRHVIPGTGKGLNVVSRHISNLYAQQTDLTIVPFQNHHD